RYLESCVQSRQCYRRLSKNHLRRYTLIRRLATPARSRLGPICFCLSPIAYCLLPTALLRKCSSSATCAPVGYRYFTRTPPLRRWLRLSLLLTHRYPGVTVTD